MPNYYEILGLPRSASHAQIRQAFRKLARQYHPDVNPGNTNAEDKFKLINEANSVDIASLKDPINDLERVQKPEWLVLIGVCTHLGCVPLGQKSSDTKGEYNGWFCPCHGSHYDTSGRIRKGPAPDNLSVPPYKFISDTKILIG